MNIDENVRTMLRGRAESVTATPVVPDRTVRRMQMRKALWAGALAVVVVVGVAGAFVVRSAFSTNAAPQQPAGAPTASQTTDEPSPTARAQDITGLPDFAPLETGTYYIDPDNDPSTPLRVVYEISAEGWAQWGGAVKEIENSFNKHVAVSITTVTNLVRHGCRNHSAADPPVGPTVDDLATALTDLAPFRVTSPPTDITKYGYRGKHLELTVPDLPVKRTSEGFSFSECDDGNISSWISPYLDRFYGHSGPGYTEEFWILDVEGSRLMIVAHSSPKAPAEDIAETRAILDSIQIEP